MMAPFRHNKTAPPSDRHDKTAPPAYGSRPAPLAPQQEDPPEKPSHSRCPSSDLKSQLKQPITSTTTSPGPSSADPQHRLLHIYHEKRHIRVMDSDKVTPLYTVDVHGPFSSHKTMEIMAGSTNQPYGTIDLGTFSDRMKLNINNDSQDPTVRTFWSNTYIFPSSIGPLHWDHSVPLGKGLACFTEAGEWVAKFNAEIFGDTHEKTLEIVDCAFPKPLVDEIVFSGLAMGLVVAKNAAAMITAPPVIGAVSC